MQYFILNACRFRFLSSKIQFRDKKRLKQICFVYGKLSWTVNFPLFFIKQSWVNSRWRPKNIFINCCYSNLKDVYNLLWSKNFLFRITWNEYFGFRMLQFCTWFRCIARNWYYLNWIQHRDSETKINDEENKSKTELSISILPFDWLHWKMET